MTTASLWLLEAKRFEQDDRSQAATSVRYWLKPGTYVVGRAGADLEVLEDKSISRKHAELIVPPPAATAATTGASEEEEADGDGEGGPHILVKGEAGCCWMQNCCAGAARRSL